MINRPVLRMHRGGPVCNRMDPIDHPPHHMAAAAERTGKHRRLFLHYLIAIETVGAMIFAQSGSQPVVGNDTVTRLPQKGLFYIGESATGSRNPIVFPSDLGQGVGIRIGNVSQVPVFTEQIRQI